DHREAEVRGIEPAVYSRLRLLVLGAAQAPLREEGCPVVRLKRIDALDDDVRVFARELLGLDDPISPLALEDRTAGRDVADEGYRGNHDALHHRNPQIRPLQP